MLHSLCTLDGQVRNGGVTQFFWNCPDLVFEVSDSLKELGLTDLLELYDKALAELIGKKDDWFELRKKSYSHPDNPSWEPFQESYKLLDLAWFDDAYFDKYDYDNQGNSALRTPGLASSLLKRLFDYLKAHKEEFIESRR